MTLVFRGEKVVTSTVNWRIGKWMSKETLNHVPKTIADSVIVFMHETSFYLSPNDPSHKITLSSFLYLFRNGLEFLRGISFSLGS